MYWNISQVHFIVLIMVLYNSRIFTKFNAVLPSSHQPDSHYIKNIAASALQTTTPCTPEGHWLICEWYYEGTTCSPSLQCTMVNIPQWASDVPSRCTAARHCRLSHVKVHFKGPWLLGITDGLQCYGSPLTVPPHKETWSLCLVPNRQKNSHFWPHSRYTRVRHCIRLRQTTHSPLVRKMDVHIITTCMHRHVQYQWYCMHSTNGSPPQ